MTTPPPEPGALSVAEHAQTSRRFLEHAMRQLDEGDRLQAAEEVWGAAAQALKSIGKQRGWIHDRHPNIFDVGEHLGREFGRAEGFDRYLARAEYVHRNSYENDSSEMSIRYALEDVERLVDELEAIRNSPPRSLTVRDNDDRIRLGRLLGLPRADRPAIGEYSPTGYSQTHSVN
jgi:hypothetical protein